MRDWLHVYCAGEKKGVFTWAYSRVGSERPLLKSTNRNWVLENAKYFASKHSLLLMLHDQVGVVAKSFDYRIGATRMGVSQDFKTHYNETMANKLKSELINLKDSPNVKDIHVRAVFKDKEEPENLVVIATMHNGQKVKIKTIRYMFPNEQLIAQIGLLI
jgi:hypothetical protein